MIPAEARSQRQQHVACRADDLPAGSRRLVTIAGRKIGLFNVDGRYYALLNRCPHGGAPLCLGTVSGLSHAAAPGVGIEWSREGEILRCPWHGWEFELATGATITEPTLRVKTFPVRVEHGLVVVEV